MGFLVMSYYNPDFESRVPAWVYFFCAFTLFAYQSLDNIDGKQARRTQSSSPLGELFDHVSDSMGVGMMIVTIGASCQVGPVMSAVVFMFVVAPFYFHHWEEKFTGELILGKFDGPTESQVFAIVLHLLNGIFAIYGIDIWNATIIYGVPGKVVFPLVFCLCCFLSSIKLQIRLWSYLSKHGISFAEGLKTGAPFIFFFASAIIYIAYTPQLLQHHRWDESRFLFFYLTILFGYLTSRLIVQRVCKEPSPVIYNINIPLLFVAAHALMHRFFGVGHFVSPHLVLKALAALAGFQCLWFFYQLNNELTAYLEIDTFHIPYPAKKATKKPKKSPTKRGRTKSPARKTTAAKKKTAPSPPTTRARSRSTRGRKVKK